MKSNQILALLAAAALLLLTSCQRDELQGGSISGEEVTVSISAVVPGDGGAVVKSDAEPGNGDQVNRCILEVYLIDGDDAALYGSREMVKVENLKASFEDLNLITGQKYRFVLWADYVDNPETVEGLAVDKFYNTDEAGGLQNVTMVTVTSDYAGNNDQRDAFFYTGEVTVEGPKDYTLELKRPFGQLNIITTDYGLIPETHKDLRPARVQLAYKSIPTGINLLTGELLSTTDGSVTVQEVEGQAVPITDLSVAGNEDARQLSFDYILAPATGQHIIGELTMSFLQKDGTTPTGISDYTIESIPVQRNYRTNVSGALLTDRAGVDVVVEPRFGGDEEVIDGKLVISSVDRLMNALENGGRVMLAKDMEIDRSSEESTGQGDDPNRIVVEEDVEIDLNGHKLTLKGESRMAANNAEIKISNGKIVSESKSAEIFRFFANDGGKVVVEDVDMNVPGTTGVGFNPGANKARLEVRNSTIVAGKYAVGTNAAKPVSGAEIVIENSKLKAQTPILVNINANTKITNCTFEGTVQGGLFRGGQYEVTGSTFILNSSTEQSGETYLNKNWADGNKVPGAALVVGNRTSDAYQYPTVLKISDSKLQSEGTGSSPAVYVYANEGEGLGVTIDYDGCEFTGDFEVASGNVTVNGSVFDKPGQSVAVSDAEDLTAALEGFGTDEGKISNLQITISEDVELDPLLLTDALVAGTSIGIDLGGHAMTLPGASYLESSGTLTLRNGTVNAPEGSAIGCKTDGEILLDNVTYETAPGWGCVFVAQNAENTSITIRNSTINGGYYALTSNASANPVATSTIVLENSTFTAAESGMMINIPCDITAKNCEFTGGWQGVFLRGGEATFTNCSINLVMDPEYGDCPEKHVNTDGTWADGNQSETAALLMGNRCEEDHPSYYYPTSVTLWNTTFSITGNNGGGMDAEKAPAISVWSRVEEGNGASLTYDDATEASFSTAGKGLVVNNEGNNLTINEKPYNNN